MVVEIDFFFVVIVVFVVIVFLFEYGLFGLIGEIEVELLEDGVGLFFVGGDVDQVLEMVLQSIGVEGGGDGGGEGIEIGGGGYEGVYYDGFIVFSLWIYYLVNEG